MNNTSSNNFEIIPMYSGFYSEISDATASYYVVTKNNRGFYYGTYIECKNFIEQFKN